jgi:hypothetical protein
MVSYYALLEIIATVLSFGIIIWMMLQCRARKKSMSSEVMQYAMFAFFFALLDITLHEFEEIGIVPFIDIISPINHIAMLVLSFSALLIFNRDGSQGKAKKRSR